MAKAASISAVAEGSGLFEGKNASGEAGKPHGSAKRPIHKPQGTIVAVISDIDVINLFPFGIFFLSVRMSAL